MAAVAVMDQLRATNSFIDRHKPWLLARRPHDEDASAWLRVVLGVSIDTVRRAVILLQPFVPDTARRAHDTRGQVGDRCRARHRGRRRHVVVHRRHGGGGGAAHPSLACIAATRPILSDPGEFATR